MSSFRCCICDHYCELVSQQHREQGFCPSCGSNARFRGIVLAILDEVFGNTSLSLARQPGRHATAGIGVSDADQYASLLAEKLGYRNTFLHQEPHLDLCNKQSVANYKNLDLLVCSDVIEHTQDLPSQVFINMMSMLKPGGIVVLSAPTYEMASSIEWYSGATSVKVIPYRDRHVVIWSTIRGNDYIDTTPCFHGGPGDVLEMRLISHSQLVAEARAAGFETRTLDFSAEHGYVWPIVPEYPGLRAAMDGRIMVLRRPR